VATATASRFGEVQSTLTLLQANVLVAMLGGFWARAVEGHPGADVLSRGVLILSTLVDWGRIKKSVARSEASSREGRH
jgi:hypothetical protein